MKKTTLAALVSLFAITGASHAQSQAPTTEIRESTDPAKVADVERRAAELQSQQQSSGSGASASGSHSGAHKKRMHGKKHSSKAKSSGAAAEAGSK